MDEQNKDKSKLLPRYDDNAFQRIDAITHARLRPGMYIGGTDRCGLHRLLNEILENSVNQAIARKATHILITLRDNGQVCVSDDGEGIPVALYEETNKSILELIIDRMLGRFSNDNQKFVGGMHGVGLSAVAALSAELLAEVRRDGYLWQQAYQMGRPITPLNQVCALEVGESTGTTITFTPDFTVLEPNDFDYDILAERCRELAFLVRGSIIGIRDERLLPVQEKRFCAVEGLKAWVEALNGKAWVLHHTQSVWINLKWAPPFEIGVDFALSCGERSLIRSFVNTSETADGTHVKGFYNGLTRAINVYGRKTQAGYQNRTSRRIRQGLIVIINLTHPSPSLQSQVRIELLNPEVYKVVSEVVYKTTLSFLHDKQPDLCF